MEKSKEIRLMSEFQRQYCMSDAKIIVAGGAAGCLPAEAEYLSSEGWKRIDEYDGNKVGVVSLNKADKSFAEVCFEQPKDYIKAPCNEMRELSSARFEMACSDEHRVVYWNDDCDAYQVLQFDEILQRHEKSTTKGWTGRIKTSFSSISGTSGIPLDEGYLRLQVAIQADGHFVKEGANNYCLVNVSKERKANRLRELCAKFNIPLRYDGYVEDSRYTAGGIHKFVVHPKLRQKRYTGIWWQATQEQLNIIADEVAYWDGSVIENTGGEPTLRYFSKYKEDADFIQYVFASQGKNTSIVKDPRERDGSYTVNANARGQGFRSFANKDGKCEIKTVPTSDGFKYCFETSTGFFLVRYKGHIFVTGNSSKSHIGLTRHLRWMHDPLYRGFCIRKNSSTIMKSGGLFDAAIHLYSQHDDIKIKLKDQKLVFSSGASVSFSHYDNDAAGQLYQGLELSNVFYDEATHASESHIWWLISRLRTKARLDPSIWLSCNPDPDSFLFDWVKWWLYPEGHEKYGLPDPEKNGKIRWVLRKEGVLVWGDSREEMIIKYGKPNLPFDHKQQVKPFSMQVVLGTIYDNPYLIENQPDYLSTLESLPDIERRRLLLGDWTAREESSTHFQRNWVQEESDEPPASDIEKTVRAYDLAGTLKSESNKSPDYTVSAKISKLKNGSYFVHEVQRTRIRFGQWTDFILENAYKDGSGVDVVIPVDPGAAAKAATSGLAKSISEHGFFVRTVRAGSSKLDRFRPFSSLAYNGAVKFLANCGTDFENNIYNDNSFVYKELESFTGKRRSGESGHDDIPDAISDAISILVSNLKIPTLSLSNMTKTNPFKL